jgi:hypothetical protein
VKWEIYYGVLVTSKLNSLSFVHDKRNETRGRRPWPRSRTVPRLRWCPSSENQCACVRVCLGYRLASTTTTVLDWDSVTQVVSILIPVSLPRIPDPDMSTVSKAEYRLHIICCRP